MTSSPRTAQFAARTLLGVILLAGCGDDGPLSAGEDTTCHPSQPLPRKWDLSNLRHKVDVLFMIDNSNGPAPVLQAALQANIGRLFDPLRQSGVRVDMQLGVVTSDYGAGRSGAPGCTPSGLSGGGDQGHLIALGKKSAADCRRPKGANFIEYEFGDLPVHNLPNGQSLEQTFGCMASLGAQGCGFEHPLESVYAALHNNISENQGFLRDDALLLVIFVTDEDDASAPPDSDLFDKNLTAQYGYESSYARQVRFGVLCGDPPLPPPYGDSHGPLARCRPAPNPDDAGPGKLYDVQRYVDFFTLPRVQGGVKDDRRDVMLAAIDGPEEPFSVILSNPGTPDGQALVRCGALNESSSPPCVPVQEDSCTSPHNASLHGHPAVRLNAVVRAVDNHEISSLCDDDYGTKLERIGRRIVAALGVLPCIRDPLPRDADCKLISDCSVTDVTLNPDGTETKTPIARCGLGALPCWVLEEIPECGDRSPDSATIRVLRGSVNGVPVEAPLHTRPNFECAAAP